jgi:hypothetical protein
MTPETIAFLEQQLSIAKQQRLEAIEQMGGVPQIGGFTPMPQGLHLRQVNLFSEATPLLIQALLLIFHLCEVQVVVSQRLTQACALTSKWVCGVVNSYSLVTSNHLSFQGRCLSLPRNRLNKPSPLKKH